jgi:glycosyltransferase involved in cell wall biosynthesis
VKVLVDLTQIPRKKAGVGIYALNLVMQLPNVDKNSIFIIVIQNDDDELSKIEYPNLIIIKVNKKIFRKFIFRCVFEQLIIPLIAIYHKVDIIHSIHYSFPLIPLKVKKVVTIHDLTFFYFPEYHQKVKIIYFRLFVYMASKYADMVIAVSRSTIKDLKKITKVNMDNVELIYLGGFIKKDNYSQFEIEKVKRKYGITKPYFLFIGMIEPRKNLVGLIKEFEKFHTKNRDYQLVIVGKIGWKSEEVFHVLKSSIIKNQIIFTGYVSDDEKNCLLTGSYLFIYPSKYEGFGLPIIEAMSLSVPTICSNISSMPEISGNAALLVNPNKKDDIFAAIYTLAENKKEYNKYKKRSPLQARKFTWEKTAYHTILAYKKTLNLL